MVVHDAVVAVPHEPADEAGAHPAEADHAHLHRVTSPVVGRTGRVRSGFG
ncbi:MAG: hypothetical protein AVDCRST_MAG52-1359 [uncultured Blastococcus sp.]|uniref:Uncharacterized protein n=1 Tax=uncultured Blastococcus sp. TaxID=217144 RepID=A0A6J4HWU9_9ACTN|nr:MAG: hypothetical protein AVDCRST_MAG52-1359 [uncultured Blastococcus sp.]